MSYSKWKSNVLDHLKEYKELNITKEMVRLNGKDYGHILPLNNGYDNYMWPNLPCDFKKQRFWYHLNSSQTMCYNFFQPLIDTNRIADIIEIIIGIRINNISTKYEYVPEGNITNFDFYVKGLFNDIEKEFFFEIKYTEETISKKTSSKNLDETFRKYYCCDAKKNTLFRNVKIDDFMNSHYQAYRNMVNGYGNNYSIFITCKDNVGTNRELTKALADIGLPEIGNDNIKNIYWEDLIIKTIEKVSDVKNLSDYYNNFKNKYLDYNK